MVNISSTGRAADDSALVKHEGARCGSDSNRDWLILQSSDVAINVATLDRPVRLDIGHSVTLVVLASSLLTCVRIAATFHVLVALQIFEGIGHQASSAASVAIATSAVK